MDQFLGAFIRLYMLGLLIKALAKQTMAFQMTEESRHEADIG